MFLRFTIIKTAPKDKKNRIEGLLGQKLSVGESNIGIIEDRNDLYVTSSIEYINMDKVISIIPNDIFDEFENVVTLTMEDHRDNLRIMVDIDSARELMEKLNIMVNVPLVNGMLEYKRGGK